MIDRNEAERIARSVTAIRPDWPTTSILTMIQRDLADWPFLDLLVGLVYVAGDRNVDGSWVSKTPARVKEQGPWRTVGIANSQDRADRERADRELEERKAAYRTRIAEIDACRLCDDEGRLPSGNVCHHDPQAEARAERGRQVVEAARRAVNASTEGVLA